MSLRDTIPAEIARDAFARELTRLAADPSIRTILEIGSSSGEGSTAALVAGMRSNPSEPRLFCLEISRERFAQLQRRYADNPSVHCTNAATVPLEEEMSEEAIREFCTCHRTFYSGETALQWRREGQDYVRGEGIPQDGIERIKREHGVETFDLVVIDGGEFSGEAEWRRVDGARFVCLDDINVAKNWHNDQRLRRDARYEMIARDETLRNGFSAYRRARTDLPVHFFTIVLNGRPFIERHIEAFRELTIPWKWHIVEGAAALRHDTAWSVANGGTLDAGYHRDGLSTDGTTAYLNALQAAFPENISVYRKAGGGVFEGKVEMVRSVTARVDEECLLWQVDADEFWTAEQITAVHRRFMQDGSRTAAFFLCDFHVGPELVTTTLNTYAATLAGEWLRTWRFRPGMQWLSHEPPRLVVEGLAPGLTDVAAVHPFLQHDLAGDGLVFRHEAYVSEGQLAFKERYYGYKNAVADWTALQRETVFPAPLKRYFGWVKDGTLVDREDAAFSIRLPRERGAIRTARAAGRPGRIVIDGVFYQRSRSSGIAQVWNNFLQEWKGTQFGDRLVVIDRGRTAPRIDGIAYADLAPHNYENLELDRTRIDDVCRFHGAAWFLSTYYSRSVSTPTVLFAHDMIPERGWFNLSDAMWREKSLAIEQAAAFTCNSQATLDDLHRYYPASAGKPAVVTSLASRLRLADEPAQLAFRNRHGLHRPYWLLVGPSPYYKNCGYFFDALRQLRTRQSFDVVCATAHGLDKWRGEFSIREYRFADADLACAYSAAEALVFPSKIEGFGLPLVEAMNCGCPVIALDTPIHREVCGDAALYCRDEDPGEAADAMARVEYEAFRAQIVARGTARARAFDWRTCAARMQHFLEQLERQRPVQG